MAVGLLGVYAVGLPLLLFYVIKTYLRARAVWEQFRSVSLNVYSEIGFSKLYSVIFCELARFPGGARSSANSQSSERLPEK